MFNSKYPLIQAPMAGGISTPKLAAAVCKAGGVGFLAGGYKTTSALKEEIEQLQKQQPGVFGVNLFVPEEEGNYDLKQYEERIKSTAVTLQEEIGVPRYHDDEWKDKLMLLANHPVPLVSFTFGCPEKNVIRTLQKKGTVVIVTITTPKEAKLAAEAGADALCLQGIEAGGHRGSFNNQEGKEEDYGILELIDLVKKQSSLPLIAAGGIMDKDGVEVVLNAGASAVQIGTAFLCCKESGANSTYKKALLNKTYKETAITRAFTGRRARGLANTFLLSHTDSAPAAYPHVHYMTQPLRKKAAKQGEANYLSLWAGIGHNKVKECSAQEIVRSLMM
ncbi:NAD(P)H-dependent flavin oxidoreductase [Priestia flexa]|uniref:NAD(P)H-dependent flavin oxidoreductase n=1 Tax=Priestia flexa TaxID=86664 RepID=UPI001B3385DE|nr:nitronate monooxygenase [Priestia flexa]